MSLDMSTEKNHQRVSVSIELEKSGVIKSPIIFAGI